MSHRQESNTQEGTERDEEQLAAAPGEESEAGAEDFQLEVDGSQEASQEDVVPPPLPVQASASNNPEDPEDSSDSEGKDSEEEDSSGEDGAFNVMFLHPVYIMN